MRAIGHVILIILRVGYVCSLNVIEVFTFSESAGAFIDCNILQQGIL
jgi:hypothetical protein